MINLYTVPLSSFSFWINDVSKNIFNNSGLLPKYFITFFTYLSFGNLSFLIKIKSNKKFNFASNVGVINRE